MRRSTRRVNPALPLVPSRKIKEILPAISPVFRRNAKETRQVIGLVWKLVSHDLHGRDPVFWRAVHRVWRTVFDERIPPELLPCPLGMVGNHHRPLWSLLHGRLCSGYPKALRPVQARTTA